MIAGLIQIMLCEISGGGEQYDISVGTLTAKPDIVGHQMGDHTAVFSLKENCSSLCIQADAFAPIVLDDQITVVEH